MSKNLIIIPTYNEIDNIERLIRAIFSLNRKFDVLVIDDSSPDGTSGAVELLRQDYPGRLNLITRPGKMGLGTAYLRGFRWAIENGYDYVFEMDADFSHDPSDLPRLLNACEKEGADLAIGSRYITGITVVDWPLGRILMSYFASSYVRFITGIRVRDTTAGFKCYRIDVLKLINLDAITFKGYAFQIEMKFAAWKLGFKLAEIPIVFRERKHGNSKMSGGIFNEALWGVIIMKIRSFFKSYRLNESVLKT